MIPDIKPVHAVVQKNRFWHLAFDDDLSKAVADMKDNTSTDVSTLHKAAIILQKEYLNISLVGSFSNPSVSKAESIQLTLKSFLHILLDGLCIDQPLPVSQKSKVITSIGQHIIFNSVERRSTKI